MAGIRLPLDQALERSKSYGPDTARCYAAARHPYMVFYNKEFENLTLERAARDGGAGYGEEQVLGTTIGEVRDALDQRGIGWDNWEPC